MGLVNKLRTRSAGFTLIELLVALILLSLVFLILASALRLGAKVWNVGGVDQPDRSEVLAAQHLLRRVLSEARPIIIQAGQNRPRRVFFTGDDHSIRFVTSLPAHLGLGGLYEVAIYMAKDPNRVEMSWRLFRRTNALVGPAFK